MLGPNRSGIASSFPAFFAIKNDLSINPSEGQYDPVTYDQVTLNDGGGFDESSGIFTAPVEGVYYFSYSTTKRLGHTLASASIIRNADHFNPKSNAYMYFSLTGGSAPINVQAVITLKPGDTVIIMRSLTGQPRLPSTSAENTAMEKSTYFTGFLIHPNVNRPIYYICHHLFTWFTSQVSYWNRDNPAGNKPKDSVDQIPFFHSRYDYPLSSHSGDILLKYGSNAQVPMDDDDDVMMNERKGVFTAPLRGIYRFFFAATRARRNYMPNRHACTVQMLKNGIQVVTVARADAAAGNLDSQMPLYAQAVLLLEPGETVSTKLLGGCGLVLMGRTATMFNGFLIVPVPSVNLKKI